MGKISSKNIVSIFLSVALKINQSSNLQKVLFFGKILTLKKNKLFCKSYQP